MTLGERYRKTISALMDREAELELEKVELNKAYGSLRHSFDLCEKMNESLIKERDYAVSAYEVYRKQAMETISDYESVNSRIKRDLEQAISIIEECCNYLDGFGIANYIGEGSKLHQKMDRFINKAAEL